MLEDQTDDTAVVVPRLLHVISKYPGSEAATEAHYWLGVAHYRMQSYRDAIDSFREYLELAPHGRYANASAQYVAKLSDEYNKQFVPLEELDKRIAEIELQLRTQPENAELELELADLLWRRGDYEKSGAVYARLVKAHPSYGAKQVVRDRVEFLPTGGFVVLSPEEVQRRAIAREPLVVTNATAFASGRNLLTRERQYYVVAGQVKNRGDSALYGVQVQVTLFGFGNVVYDTGTSNIGRMNPGEVRAFSMQFSNFPEIADINRYTVVPTFQR